MANPMENLEHCVPLLSENDDSSVEMKMLSSPAPAPVSSSSSSLRPSNRQKTILKQTLIFLVILGFCMQTLLWTEWESEQELYVRKADSEIEDFEYSFSLDSQNDTIVPNNFSLILKKFNLSPSAFEKIKTKQSSLKPPMACDIPLQVHPFDPSIAKFLKKIKPIYCAEKKEYAVLDDAKGLVKPMSEMMQKDTVICQWNTIKPIFWGNQTLKYALDWQRFDKEPVDMQKLKLTNIHVLCKHNWVFDIYSQFFEWPYIEPDNREQEAKFQRINSSKGKEDETLHLATKYLNKTVIETSMDSLAANDSIPSNCSINPSVLILMVESLSRLNSIRYMNKSRAILDTWPGVVRSLDGIFKLGDNSYPNIYPLLTGRLISELNKTKDNLHQEIVYQSLIWKLFERMRGHYHAVYEDMPYWGTWQAYSAIGLPHKPADVHPREYFCALDNFHLKVPIEGKCQSTSYHCHRGETQFGLSLRTAERFMKNMIAQDKKFFVFTDPCKYL